MNTIYKNDRLGRITLEYLAQAKNLISGIWEKSSNFFFSHHWKEILFDLKTASIIICLIFGGLVIFLLLKMNAKGRAKRAVLAEDSPSVFADKKKINKKWKKIQSELSSDSAENNKLAVLEAGELFERVLQALGKAAEIRITNGEEIQAADKVKNKIIDNSDFRLNKEEAVKAVKAYNKGLIDLGVV